MPKKLTTKEFIDKARKVHGNKYDYTKVEYINSHTKVCIICPKHGEFWQKPNNHIGNNQGCPKCCRTKKLITEEFIKEAKEIHGNKYDYSKVEYINNKTKVCIICPIHGEFWQTPNKHLSGNGCKECGNIRISKSRLLSHEDFMKKLIKIHGDKYNYSKTQYLNANTKVCVICPIHGEFWMLPSNLTAPNHPQGCPKCGRQKRGEDQTYSLQEIIKLSKETHGDKYDYSKVKYINYHTKVCIICHKHGEFWQRPADHIRGNGCPICKASKLEEEMSEFLRKNNINFCQEHTFDWLKNKHSLKLDFFLTDYNLVIECQGMQHFKPVNFGTQTIEEGNKKLARTLESDKIKYNLCQEHGIKVLYYSNLGIDYPYHVFEDKDELLKEIKKHESNSTQSEQQR